MARAKRMAALCGERAAPAAVPSAKADATAKRGRAMTEERGGRREAGSQLITSCTTVISAAAATMA